MADYYDILGVARDASDSDIKTAYRKLAMKYHPDRNPDNPESQEKFKEITAAYQILSKPEKRQRYDMGGEQFSGFSGGGDFGFDVSDALNIFMNAFGGGGGFSSGFGGQRGSTVRRGKDLKARIALTLEEIYSGTDKTLKVSRFDFCSQCDGTGAEKGSKLVNCSTCAGQGQIRRVRNSFFGQQMVIESCPDCEGRGKKPEKICKTCRGKGIERIIDTVEVKVPAGVGDGNYMVVEGKGDAGVFGGPTGKLIVVFQEKAHKLFTRKDNDLVFIQPITFSQASLGAHFPITSLRGDEALEIPSGTQWGKVIKIRGGGMPKLNSERFGDLLVQIVIVTPKKLNTSQRKAFEALAKTEDPATIEKGDGSLLHKLKDFLGF